MDGNPTIFLRQKKQKADASRKPLMILARPERFELPTPWFVARYSIQLSYGRVRARILSQDAAIARAEPGWKSQAFPRVARDETEARRA